MHGIHILGILAAFEAPEQNTADEHDEREQRVMETWLLAFTVASETVQGCQELHAGVGRIFEA